MSKFSDLIQKKHEMLKVTMKVDPAACKNGEITHFQEYVGFVLAEKEFEKTYEKLLKQYTLQNEGFFDTVKGALKAITRRLAKDITEPFTDTKYNPFVEKEKAEKEGNKNLYNSNQIINEIQKKYFNYNKYLNFNISDIGNENLKYKDLLKFLETYNKYRQLFINTDLNKQINVKNLEKTYIPYITKEIEDFEKTQKIKTKFNSKQVWSDLVKYVESVFKDTRPTKDILNKKIMWMYILASQNQVINF